MKSWVRPFIAIVAVLGINAGFFLKMITAEAYMPLMATAITWWFTARDNAKQNGGDKN
jgi:hypothetical protein